MTETILLGNLAVWLAAAGEGEKIEWDAKNLAVKNIPGLEPLIKREYRQGYRALRRAATWSSVHAPAGPAAGQANAAAFTLP